ncbi:bifunctional pantoate--beta-alanine ligase/(d)CMP kinase [Microseira wollei]|uniref:bifunctional pantoate--beta-alanine ligase/(d)CMP kinase n=1 Tax=Microseira wollei TaxID=467598 RepID=UPI001CFD4567|nr:bifunctional pantoate--beta-alanine ligase/(d)CMP kinase [Microseira wollei]
MRLFTTVAGLRCYLRRCRFGQSTQDVEIGLVPTMGALHIGHLSLIERARQENNVVIVSIFVNPLQFGPNEDFQQYPRRLEQDRQLCQQAGVDAIFAPAAEEVIVSYANRSNSPPMTHDASPTAVVPPESMTSVLCGRFRPGHFQGVATIVTKLLNLVQPNRAYFGQKDAQQLAIIRRLVADLNIPVEIVACPTVREASGLAFSSRNQYLTPEQKQQAAVLYRSLQQAAKAFKAGEQVSASLKMAVEAELASEPAIKPEYVELVHPNTLMPLDKVEEVGLLAIAVRLGATRLIDNILLQNRKPIVAIDGPAGAGKSTVARAVAKELGLLYLDTGAMYRAVTWLVLKSGISMEDEPAIAEITSQCDIQLAQSDEPNAPIRVWINGFEVTQAIRSLEVTSQVSAIAADPSVRQQMVKKQQRWGEKGGIVMEGRDIGTNVFPDAELKIFLTASVGERAKRRQQDLKVQGEKQLSLAQLEKALSERDFKDSHREVAPLQKAADAFEIQTDNLSIAEVTNRIITLYCEKGLYSQM